MQTTPQQRFFDHRGEEEIRIEMTVEGGIGLQDEDREKIRLHVGAAVQRYVGMSDQIMELAERKPEALRDVIDKAMARACAGVPRSAGTTFRLLGTNGHDYTPEAARAPF